MVGPETRSDPSPREGSVLAQAGHFGLLALLWIVTIAIPPILWLSDLPFTGFTATKIDQLFELFGMTGTAVLLVQLLLATKRVESFTIESVVPVVASTLVAFCYLQLYCELSVPTRDYLNYQDGAKAIVEGTTVYVAGKQTYPPLLMQLIAGTYGLVQGVSGWLRGAALDQTLAWYLTFYVYACGQFLAVWLAYALCVRFACRLEMSSLHSAVLVALLFLVNNPLLRTVRYNQMNPLVLDSILVSMLLLWVSPFMSGLALAVGAHLKLYPLLLLLPFLAARRWRAIAGAVVGIAGIAAVQTGMSTRGSLWQQYLEVSQQFYSKQSHYFTSLRDSSFNDILYNTTRLATLVVGGDVRRLERPIQAAAGVLTAAALGWLIYRTWRRNRMAATGGRVGAAADARARSYADGADATAFMLLVSPIVWEHHFVLAMPAFLYAAAEAGRRRAVAIFASAILLFAIPTFNFYLLSYHRLAGLLILLWVTGPMHVYAASDGFRGQEGRAATLGVQEDLAGIGGRPPGPQPPAQSPTAGT